MREWERDGEYDFQRWERIEFRDLGRICVFFGGNQSGVVHYSTA